MSIVLYIGIKYLYIIIFKPVFLIVAPSLAKTITYVGTKSKTFYDYIFIDTTY